MQRNRYLKDIRIWSKEKQDLRVVTIANKLKEKIDSNKTPEELLEDSEIGDLVDESIILWLEILSSCYPKKSSMISFDEVLAKYELRAVMNLIHFRYEETKELLQKFRSSQDEEKQKFRNELVNRGFI